MIDRHGRTWKDLPAAAKASGAPWDTVLRRRAEAMRRTFDEIDRLPVTMTARNGERG